MAREARAPKPEAARSSTRRVAADKRAVSAAKPAAAASQPPRNVRVPRSKAARDRPAGPGLGERLRGLRGRANALGQRWSRPAAIGLKVLMLAGALAGAVMLGKLLQRHLTTSPAFAIDKIEVQGISRMERAEVLAAAGIA
ncbi:MAG TPA: hypothetical protein VFZ61_30105, partial [Polyangiales bacterium]